MKLRAFTLLLTLSIALPHLTTARAAETESTRQEARLAAARGLNWLRAQQTADGSFGLPGHPALTALAATAFLSQPEAGTTPRTRELLDKALAHLCSLQKDDGGIYESALANYNTSLSVVALAAANRPEFTPVIRRARAFIIGQQNDLNEPGKLDHPGDGGIGYGNSNPHADLSNTLCALEALRASQGVEEAGARALNWEAAIQFLTRCQQLPSHNKEGWVSQQPEDRGGFVYYPGESRAGAWTNAAGVVALRSYGSMTYAGLMSLLHAELKRDDPRVTAAVDWAARHFTLKENPGMGASGLVYYYTTMAKALDAHGTRFVSAPGGPIEWRRELIAELIGRQQADGSWINTESARWMERDPVLVTSYAVLALSRAAEGL